MLKKLKEIEEKYVDIENRMATPEVYSDVALYAKLAKDQKELMPLVETYRRYRKFEDTAIEARELLDAGVEDADFKEMLREEYEDAKRQMEAVEQELKILLLPTDPNDDKNVIIEIRGGAGGDEAALFAYNLYRMYAMYAESKRWKTEIAYINETEIGGIKEVSFVIEGAGAYSRLKFESG
ncbi:MAG: PCRF domain-containing protein, partial [Oscillospiraceae bacterium]